MRLLRDVFTGIIIFFFFIELIRINVSNVFIAIPAMIKYILVLCIFSRNYAKKNVQHKNSYASYLDKFVGQFEG